MNDATPIFAEHRVALEQVAARITGDREDARDLVADAFVALIQAGPTDSAHAVPWLYVTVRNKAYNRVRDRARADRRLPSLAAEANSAAAPESRLPADDRLRQLLAGAVAGLSERDRMAVALRHLQGASYEDVAEAVGTTPSQARVVVHRATSRLRHRVVDTLARRHGARHRRASSIAEGARHDGCASCVAVSDEVAALLQGAAVIPLIRPGRVSHAVREWCRRASTAGSRVVGYLGEVAAPTAALVAMTVGPAAPPSLPTVPTGTEGPVVAAAARHGTASAATGPQSGGLGAGSGSPPRARPVAGEVLGTPLSADDPGTSRPGLTGPVGDQRRTLLATLGLPLGLPDPLDAPKGPSLDVRSLEVATMADEHGRPAAVRWRLTFANTPPASTAAWVSWRFGGSACWGSLSVPSESVWFGCPGGGLAPLLGSSWTAPARPGLAGRTLEATIPFATLDPAARDLLRPGAELVGIVATAACDALRDGCDNGDRVPDSGDGYSYRVEGDPGPSAAS